MAINVTGKRLSAAQKLRDKGFLVSVRGPVYTGDVRSGWTTVKTWAVLEKYTPFHLPEDLIVGTQARLVMAALEWDETTQSFGAVIDMDTSHQVLLHGRWLGVFEPGAVQPSSQPILYQALIGERKEVA